MLCWILLCIWIICSKIFPKIRHCIPWTLSYLSVFFKALQTFHIFRNAIVDWKYVTLAIGIYLSLHSLLSFLKRILFKEVTSYSNGGIGFWKYSFFPSNCRDNWENTKHIYLFTEKCLTLLWNLQLAIRNFNWKSPWEARGKVNMTGKSKQKAFQLVASFLKPFKEHDIFPS